MPATIEKEPVTETSTRMAADLQAKTDKAVSQITNAGFSDPDFEAGLQAAIDKDAGKEPAKKEDVTPEPDKKGEEKKTETAPSAKVTDDIPAELFGEPKKEEAKPDEAAAAKAEEERKKAIEEQTKGMTPKAAERFRKIESRAAEAEQRAKKIAEEREAEKIALQKQIDELKAATSVKKDDPTELDALRKQLEEAHGIINKAALSEDPRFKAAFDGKISTEIERIKKVVPADKAEEIADLLAIPESKKRNERIEEIADELDSITRTKLLNTLSKVDELATEKAAQLANWKENKIHIEAAAIRDKEANNAKIAEIQQVAWAKGMESVSSPQTGLEVFRKLNGNDEWNAKVEARSAAVKQVLSQNLQPEQLVELAARAVAVDEYRKMFLAQRVLVQKLSDELESLKKAEPEPGDVGGDGSAADTDDFVTAAVKGALKAGGLQR